ncbi:transposase, partial [Saccharothrix sp. ST-888]|uniref:transposase n=1 Tax=Saccharothrix sp. ST-888 TaxID=1427391 RepID=UPI0022B1B487
MTDAEWAAVRDLLPAPAWMSGRGGRPEGCCHRRILDAIRYLVDNGVKWAALPAASRPTNGSTRGVSKQCREVTAAAALSRRRRRVRGGGLCRSHVWTFGS